MFLNPLSGVECCRASRGQIPTANDSRERAGAALTNHALRGGWCRVRGSLNNSLPIHYRSVITCLPSLFCRKNVTRLPAGRYKTLYAQGALYLPRATPQILLPFLPSPYLGLRCRRVLPSTTTLSIVPTHTSPYFSFVGVLHANLLGGMNRPGALLCPVQQPQT